MGLRFKLFVNDELRDCERGKECGRGSRLDTEAWTEVFLMDKGLRVSCRTLPTNWLDGGSMGGIRTGGSSYRKPTWGECSESA
jgi:hypothetical protein